jgi:FkbM family methyltransferase
LEIRPVLIDIGASGAPPRIWDEIAQESIYVAFDPDLRDIHEVPNGRFYRAITVNEAVTDSETGEVRFYLTSSPYCSSTLKPDQESLANFLYSDLFSVEREVSVRAATLNAILDRLSLDRIDWFKTDSQGTDLRIFNSIREAVRSRVLAIDIEPGLLNAYVGEDLFADVQRELVGKGFWLSDLKVCGTLRMTQQAFADVLSAMPEVDRRSLERNLKKTPGWCEARYLRAIQSLIPGRYDERDFVLLWIFSVMDLQFGFALDVVLEYERRFGRNRVSARMKTETLASIRTSRANNPQRRPSLKARTQLLEARAKALLPPSAKRWLKQLKRSSS